MLAAFAMTVALVAQHHVPMRAAAQPQAPQQAMLVAGDWLEVRGESRGYLHVYDHRRERPGYVKKSTVRTYPVEEAAAPALAAVVEYLKDASGQESLGIGYAALFLKAAPPQAIGPFVFDAIGTMAERLARRASARVAGPEDKALSAELETVESYGVHFARIERDGQTRVCYDGEAFRRVVAMGGTGASRVRAAMGLTDPACVDPAAAGTANLDALKLGAEVLDGIDVANLGPDVAPSQRAALQARRATTHALVAYYAARAADETLAQKSAEKATRALHLVERKELADEDRFAYEEAALRVASVRWGAEKAPAPAGDLEVEIARGEPGQTCVRVKRRSAKEAAPFSHCTYAVVWPGSLRVAPRESAVTLAVSPLPGWTELLVLRPKPGGFTADTLLPAALDPSAGYAELAGFSPDGARMLVAREAVASGPLGSPNTLAPWVQKSFRVVALADMKVDKDATSIAAVPAFRTWQSPDWRAHTVALR